ncbi:MAG: hypothetical protein U0587_15305 [Candidatus Binatia bacterium]
MRWVRLVVAILLGAGGLRAPRAHAVCVGDCNSDSRVAIDELILGVNIALGNAAASACAAINVNADTKVTIDELIGGVHAALHGCATSPTPTTSAGGSFVGSYIGVKGLPGGRRINVTLTAQDSGRVAGSLVDQSRQPQLNVPLQGTFNLGSGDFAATGTFQEQGTTRNVSASGRLPARGTIEEIVAQIDQQQSIARMRVQTQSTALYQAQNIVLDATHLANLGLSHLADDLIAGTLAVRSTAAAGGTGAALTLPAGTESAALLGMVTASTGDFWLTGDLLYRTGETFPVYIGGRIPPPTGSSVVELYIGDEMYAVTLTPPTTPPTPTPTPPGAGEVRLVYSQLDGDLAVNSPNGTAVQQLTSTAGAFEGYPAWSADGSMIAYAIAIGDNAGIYVMTATGANPQKIASGGVARAPAWSPDGTRISFVAGDRIDIVNSNGSGRQTLLANIGGEQYGPMAWSPDGTKIAFESTRGKGSTAADAAEIFVMNADGSGVVQLTDNAVPDIQPDWSPDGARITFATRRPDEAIRVIMVNGGGEQALVSDTDGASNPAWSHDGTQLAYLARGAIKIAHADGTPLTKVPGNVFAVHVDFK